MARFMIAGVSSSCGKTSVVCGILKALKDRGHNIRSYKCGPDYIDGMLHKRAIGIPSGNLDSFFCTRDEICTLLDRDGISVIEGVMGYYDGIAGSERASSYDIAEMTDTPVVLVINCKGISNSAGAIIKGFSQYKDNSHIKGVIFNRLSPMLYESMKELCNTMGIKAYGFLPEIKEAELPSRHLGLVTDEDMASFRRKIDILAENTEKYIDINGLLELGEGAEDLSYKRINIEKISDKTIAVAKDNVFCFNYEDNIWLLKEMGCDIVYFSPLKDKNIPPCDKLILSGGYPELYAKELSENKSMLMDIKSKIKSGLNVIAECGGFMYLHEYIDGVPMAGVIRGNSVKGSSLKHFGYITMTAQKDNILCKKGEEIKAHEFHYYRSDNEGRDFHAVKPLSKRAWHTGHLSVNMYCGFPHIYLWGNRKAAENFVR